MVFVSFCFVYFLTKQRIWVLIAFQPRSALGQSGKCYHVTSPECIFVFMCKIIHKSQVQTTYYFTLALKSGENKRKFRLFLEE